MKTSIVVRKKLTEEVLNVIVSMIDKINWPLKRKVMGEVTLLLLDGKPRVAEDVFGWGRATVQLGMNEFRSSIDCINDLSARKKPKAEEKNPKLLVDIVEIMTPYSQAEPSLRTTILYTDLTAKAVYGFLIGKGWCEHELPTVRTISNILNRLGYRLRTVAKTRVQKKTPYTDAIFENVHEMNAIGDADPETLRISIDTKATIDVGEYSRDGRSRGLEPVEALDHDMQAKQKIIPGGILEPKSGKAFLFFSNSYKTSDFMVDGLTLWWEERKQNLPEIKRIVINMDNGPECSGRRTQFLKRMVDFVDTTGLDVHLVYYPPYHSKYNAIERYWAGLEKSWNGYLLDSVNCILNRAGNFIWKGCRANVKFINTIYEKGIKVLGKEKDEVERRLKRSDRLALYDIEIIHKAVI